MRWSGFFKSKTFVANAVVALLLAVVVATGLNWMLKLATGHGRLTAVPDVSYLTLDQALEAEAQAQAICMQTQDFKRAFDAFAAKQTPVFGGD